MLYVIGIERGDMIIGPCKIGISNSPTARLAALQTGHYRTLRLVLTLDCNNAYSLEQRVHEWLSDMGVKRRGEWFVLSPFEATCVVMSEHINMVGGGIKDVYPRDVVYAAKNCRAIESVHSEVLWALNN